MAKFKPQYRRLLYIDRKIREGRYPNCASLAEEWETSTRTILRDLEYLKEQLDAPLEYDAVKHGFRYTDPAWFLPSVLLSEGDLLALLIGRQAMNMYRGTPVAEDLERVFAKLTDLLPERVAIGPEFIEARFSFFHPPARPIDAAIWRTVLRALTHQRALEIDYQSPAAAGRAKPHTLRPYHVVNLEGEWYLLAHEERWNELRQFALSRIRAARVLERTFDLPDDFDAAEVLQHRFGRYLHAGAKGTVKVRLRFAPVLAGYISEKVWHPRQRLRQRRDGSLDLDLPVAEARDLEAWLLSLGEYVEVLAPAALRDAVRERHARAAAGKGRAS